MEKQTAGLIGILAGLATMGAAPAGAVPAANAQAAPAAAAHELLHATSYADLLKPIPNAAEVLKASDAELLTQAKLQDAQYYNAPPPPPPGYYHHHHHHHHYYPPPPPVYHHHHHHHHHGVTIVVPGVGAIRTN